MKGTDAREAFLADNLREDNPIPDEAIADLKYFAKRAKEGRAITFRGLQQWMKEKYALSIGRVRMQTLAKQHGCEPWWA